MSNPAYIAGLKLLAGRELSEAQVRQRLARRGYNDVQIEDAVTRLRESRAIDDERVATAIARTETTVKRRGKLRVLRQLEQAGIAPALASRAVADVFDDLDPDALIETALARRLRGRSAITDEKEFQRLYRYLVAQGFEHDRVMKTLAAHRR